MKTKLSVVLLTLLMGLHMNAQSPNGFRGNNRTGNYNENGLMKSWPADGPQLLWETMDAGKGYSSPVVVDGRLYITGMNEAEDREIFSAYTLEGEKLYVVEYGNPWSDSYPETRTTPTIEDGKAYVISGSGEVVCLDIANGNIIWQVDGGKLFERKTGTWGISECPLVFDNKVIYTPSGDQTTMVALNAGTGEVVWKSKPLGDGGAYVSPILVNHNGKKQIIGSTGVNLIGVDPETGDIQWTFGEWGQASIERGWDKIAPNSPVYHNGRVFFCHGYDMGGFMLRLNDDATNVELVWSTDVLDTHHGGYVLKDGILYGSNWINNNQGNWVALDWATGEPKYETAWPGNGKGSIIEADDMLYCYDERRGMVGLVKPTPEKFDVVSQFRITKGEGPHWAHPVIRNGVLYIRHGNALMAFKIA